MTRSPELDENSRLLVLVPHPDDETLATGGLLQMALAAGARVRVVIATDGDNNPWPQRWIEKRWRIDASARARWGTRRRAEASTALARLGVAERDVRCFGWPDQGLTALLMDDAKATRQLASEVLDFSPTLIAAPALSDLHPDHNALGTMLDLALSSGPLANCPRIEYVVHGELPGCDGMVAAVEDGAAERKLHALQAHASQLVLSGKRMTRLCKRRELFAATAKGEAETMSGTLVWRWQISSLRYFLQRHAALLIVRRGPEVQRLTLPLARTASGRRKEVSPVGGTPLVARLGACVEGIELELQGVEPFDRAYAKLERLGHRVLIHDRHGWSARGGGGSD